MTRRIIVGISGASGIIYWIRVREALRAAELETHLVMTRGAQVTLGHELSLKAHAIPSSHIHRSCAVGVRQKWRRKPWAYPLAR